MNSLPTNILVRRVDNLGDMVLVLPVLRELRAFLPDARFTLMVRPDHRGVFYGYADNFLDPLPLQALSTVRRQYDLVVNVEYSFPKNYRPRHLGQCRTVHIGTPDWTRRQHVYRHLLDGLAQHGVPVTRSIPRVRVDPAARKRARSWLERHRHDRTRFNILVNPGSGLPAKRWNVTSYAVICQWLIRTFDASITVLGRGDEPETRWLHDALPRSRRRLLVRKSIGDIAAIMTEYDLLIGNDSGTSHLAAGLGLPTVTVFGLTSPGLWKPVGRKAVTIFNHTIDCACGYEEAARCPDPVCLTSITPRHVVDGILFSINRHIPRHRLACLDRIYVSPTVRFDETSGGVMISDTVTNHACLVYRGWKYVMGVLQCVRDTASFHETLQRFPEDRGLLDLLLLHRVLRYGYSLRSPHVPAAMLELNRQVRIDC